MNTRAAATKAAAAKGSSKPAAAAAAPKTNTPTEAPPAADQPLVASGEIDISKYAGAGLEEAGTESFAIPFLRVIQTNSPEVDEAHARYNKNAKAGMLLNTVTGELFDGKEGALFIPCHYERKQLRWAPRGSGSSYRGEVSEVDAAKAREANKLVDHEGRSYFTDDGKVDDKKNDRLVDTRLHFGLVMSAAGIPGQVLMPLVSTQIKKSKLFNSMQRERVRNIGGKMVLEPSFLYAYRVTTVRENNDKGAWYGVHFKLNTDANEKPLPVSPSVFEFGASFYEALKANTVKIDLAGAAEHVDDAGGAAGGDPDKF